MIYSSGFMIVPGHNGVFGTALSRTSRGMAISMQETPPDPSHADDFKPSDIPERQARAVQLLSDPTPLKPQAKGFLKTAWESVAGLTRNLVGQFLYGGIPQPMPAEEAKHLASQENQALMDEFGTTDDNKLHARLDKAVGMAHDALPNANFSGKTWILDTDEQRGQANADGSIILSRGLMNRISDEELLFVVGHEMGHLDAKHDPQRMAYEQRLATAKSAGKQAYFAQRMMEFYHDAERQADDYGVKVLEYHGLGKEHAVGYFIRKMTGFEGGDTASETHPSDAARAWRVATDSE